MVLISNKVKVKVKDLVHIFFVSLVQYISLNMCWLQDQLFIVFRSESSSRIARAKSESKSQSESESKKFQQKHDIAQIAIRL